MPKIKTNCKNCGKEIEYWPSQNRSFCSTKCSAIDRASKLKEHIYIRLFKKIRLRYPFTCWYFTGFKDRNGYGKLSNRNGRGGSPERASRVMYEIINGDMPPSKPFVLHKCDNPSCVNPDHLYAGDQFDNMQDASDRNRLNEKSLENLQAGAKGYRGAGPK